MHTFKEHDVEMYETALPELDSLLLSCHSIREVEAATELVVPRLFPEWSGALRLIENGNVSPPGAPDAGDRRDSFTAADCWALRHGRIRVTNRSQAAPLCAHLRPSLPGTHFCVPLFDDNKVLGILHVFARGVHGEASLFAHEELKAKEALAVVGSRISAALANLRRNSPLVTPTLDDFTGLFSRTHLEKALERDLVRAETQGRVVSVMMMDLDRFDQFKNECGEAAGGILVQAVAQMIRSQTRPKDYACRYQRSEFALVMPEAASAVACERAERFRATVRTIGWCHNPTLSASVTLSAGVATFPDHASDSSSLLRAAGAALCRATESGCDRVVAVALGRSAVA